MPDAGLYSAALPGTPHRSSSWQSHGLLNGFRLFTGCFVIACMVEQDCHANGRGEETRYQAGKEVAALLIGILIRLVLSHQIG